METLHVPYKQNILKNNKPWDLRFYYTSGLEFLICNALTIGCRESQARYKQFQRMSRGQKNNNKKTPPSRFRILRGKRKNTLLQKCFCSGLTKCLFVNTNNNNLQNLLVEKKIRWDNTSRKINVIWSLPYFQSIAQILINRYNFFVW